MKFDLGNFCPPNQTLTPHFSGDRGVSPCFAETVMASSGVIYMMAMGSLELLLYKRYSTANPHYALPFSQLYGLQVVFNGCMPVICVLSVLIQLFVFKPGIMYGYMILPLLEAFITWPLVLLLINWERRYMLPTPPSRGHGIILLIFWTAIFSMQNLLLLNIRDGEWFFLLRDFHDVINFSLFLCRYFCTAAIFFLGLKAPGIPSVRHSESFQRLHPEGETDEGGSYSQGSPFRNLWQKLKMLAPFIWPRKSIWLQLSVIMSVVLLVFGRLTNIFVPLYSKKIVDSMTIVTNSTITEDSWQESMMGVGPYKLKFRWDLILIYVGLKVVQGGGAGGTGLLNNVRSLLWISVEQYTTREVQIKFFDHLHGLSLRWHLQRKTGEVLRGLDRGTDSVNSILNYLLFSILPTIADIIIAVVYFTMFFNWWFGLIVFITMVLYLIATFAITEWRTKFRRTMNLLDNQQKQRAIDSLLNFETVKYYANERYETERYASSIRKYQKEEWKVTASLTLLNMMQVLIISVGLLIGSLLCVKLVVDQEGLTVGDYVMFTVYLMQLYAPLGYFGTYYRMLQKCFIDMENMLDLFKEMPEVTDEPGAPDLTIKNGVIEFRNVNFSYVPEKSILSNVSFVVPAGQSVALVGPSGGGKSTIVRLLFRFYDPSSGEIFVDGQNIKQVTQLSLRKAVGVVPQDTVLFNDDIKYNIAYGKIGAEEEEIFKAAEGACIHEKIMTFPERYDTQVGERGLKLSGGEKQRVAIARTILKSPAVILLDEATSALDTQTERQIQSSLQMLCANRTSIIVAHRLSTIVNCNQILVIKDGCIVEGGTHDDLLSQNGVYANMWNEQSTSNPDNNGNNNNAADNTELISEQSNTTSNNKSESTA